jgi:hypothetical protein
LWPGRTRVRGCDQTAPRDEVGRAVVAIDDAFDQHWPIVVDERDLDRVGQFSTIDDADAASTSVLSVEEVDQTRHLGLARVDWMFTLTATAYDLVQLSKLVGAVA